MDTVYYRLFRHAKFFGGLIQRPLPMGNVFPGPAAHLWIHEIFLSLDIEHAIEPRPVIGTEDQQDFFGFPQVERSFLALAIRVLLVAAVVLTSPLLSLDRPGTEFSIYQFPADNIPRIDGNPDDWAMVPESYVIGMNELWDDSGKNEGTNPESLDVRLKVDWVEGMSRLYFLYEAFDDYWHQPFRD